jgi:uroporphyrinogen-III synthase
LKDTKLSILVTRPKHQADELCHLIEQHGWRAIRFPTLEIVGINTPLIQQQLKSIDQYDWLIFISANAVNFALMANDGKIDNLLERSIAAVGIATEKELIKAGLTVSLTPETMFNSEGLLKTEQMTQVKGLSCLIIRGKGGQETLASGLCERGAKVDYLEVYSREMPVTDNSGLIKSIQQQSLDAITITSGDALNNLLQMIDEKHHKLLFSIQLIVISGRIKKMAKTIGFKYITVAEKAGNSAMIKALSSCFSVTKT